MDHEKERKSVSSQEREMQIYVEELHGLVERGILVEVEHVKAGAMLDEVFMAEARAKTMQQEREVVYVAFAMCGQLPQPGKGMERL